MLNNISKISEINWEEYNLSDNVYKIYKTKNNYLLIYCGINDILAIFDEMFKIVFFIYLDK